MTVMSSLRGLMECSIQSACQFEGGGQFLFGGDGFYLGNEKGFWMDPLWGLILKSKTEKKLRGIIQKRGALGTLCMNVHCEYRSRFILIELLFLLVESSNQLL